MVRESGKKQEKILEPQLTIGPDTVLKLCMMRELHVSPDLCLPNEENVHNSEGFPEFGLMTVGYNVVVVFKV